MKAWFKQAIFLLIITLGMVALLPANQTEAGEGERDSNYIIELQYADIDVREGEPDIPSSLRIDGYQRSSEAGYYLVQSTDVILPEWKASLEATGSELLGYVPNNAFIVRMTEAERASVASLESVQWVGIYQPAYRIAPWMPTEREGQAMLVVLTFPGVDLENITSQLESWGGQIASTSENEFRGKARLEIDLSYVPQIARLNGVMWIEPWVEPQLTNDVARGIMDVEETVWNTHGLYGAGQIVAVADTGLDVGQNDASMSDDFEGRIKAAYALGRPNSNDWSDPDGHGTHVAGSVLGNGRHSGSDPTTHNYAGSHAGVAPEAQLVFQSTMAADGSLDGLPDDLGELFKQAYYDDGARIHSNSWGASVEGAYTANSSEVDQFAWHHPDMLILFAAGNDGVDANRDGVVDLDSINSPATAKNVLTVGATENNRPTLPQNVWGLPRHPTLPILNDLKADNPQGMAAFSSRGPVDGNRIKPDLVAPGTYILSARTHQHTMDMDAESGAEGWTAEGSWAITTTEAFSGTRSWSTGSYGNNQDITLTSPVMDIRTGADTITFWTRYDLGAGDIGYVQFLSGTQTLTFNAVLTDTENNWSFKSYTVPSPILNSMSAEAKQNFRIRLGLVSDDSDTGSGWFVDDIQVTPRIDGFDIQSGVPNQDYIYAGGTSMSTPLVAGAAALVREYYMTMTNTNPITPSAALIKATLVNGAVNIAPGQYGTGATQEIPNAVPNNVIGWGRVNLEESLFPASGQRVNYHDINNANGLNTTETHVYEYEVGANVPFRATLVWTDYPSRLAAAGSLVNNLDLVVRMPNGDLLYPNGLTGADPYNNTEDIFVDTNSVIAGTYVITVTAENIPEPPSEPGQGQGYALVVRGGSLQEDPTSLELSTIQAHAGANNNRSQIVLTMGLLILSVIAIAVWKPKAQRMSVTPRSEAEIKPK